MRPVGIALLVLLAAGTQRPGVTEAAPGKLLPPAAGLYHAAFPGFSGSEDHVTAGRVRSFERLAGKRIAWAYFSDNWGRGIRFPLRAVRRIRRAGTAPFVRLMPRSDFEPGGPDERFTMQRIVSGEFDRQLRDWGRSAAAQPFPILVEFGTEVNGSWFPWNGAWNGGGRRTGYGDPALADGPERFRDAFRHVHDLFAAEGADNLTWFYHPDVGSLPERPWNTAASYYPGDAYVDWIGVSAYASQQPGEDFWPDFPRLLRPAYSRLTALAPSKPLAVLELGAAEDRGLRKERFVRRALSVLAGGRFPQVKAAAWWNERWRNGDGSVSDLRIASSPLSLRAYRHGVRGSAWIGRARFGPAH